MYRPIFLTLAAVLFFSTPFPASAYTLIDCRNDNGVWDEEQGECYFLGQGGQVETRSVTPAAKAPQAQSGGQGSINIGYLKGYGDSIVYIINFIFVPVVIALAFLLFIWGVFKAYFWKGASETDRASGHQFILWAVIGFAVIFAVWGLVNMVDSILNFGQAGKTAPKPPTI